MHVVRIQPNDIDTLSGWWRARAGHGFPPGWLPETGFWVPGILGAFLYRTDSKVAYIECVISNPDSKKSERYQALAAVGKAIAEEAKEQGFHYLIGLTSLPSVAECGSKEDGYIISELS